MSLVEMQNPDQNDRTWECGVGVSRSLRMGKARGSIPRTSITFYL